QIRDRARYPRRPRAPARVRSALRPLVRWLAPAHRPPPGGVNHPIRAGFAAEAQPRARLERAPAAVRRRVRQGATTWRAWPRKEAASVARIAGVAGSAQIQRQPAAEPLVRRQSLN